MKILKIKISRIKIPLQFIDFISFAIRMLTFINFLKLIEKMHQNRK